ncbi:MAG: pilus assembly protein [Hyphomicrobiaceae bacterium]|nr:pilus assembly protein [Hyphomicrobiaceae bacterium]
MFKSVQKMRKDQRGNVAVVFALATLPVLGLMGSAMDYSRATRVRNHLQHAADAAALAGANATDKADAERRTIASNVFNANIKKLGDLYDTTFSSTPKPDGMSVVASAKVKNHVAAIMGKTYTQVGVDAEALVGTQDLELALVLDNTGSMGEAIADLKVAAKDLTQLVMRGGGKDSVRLAVVPYVAAVNPGTTEMKMAYMDQNAKSKHHAQALEWQWTARRDHCTPEWEKNPGDGGGDGGGGWTGPGSGSTEGFLQVPKTFDPNRLFASIGAVAGELFGINQAQAWDDSRPPVTVPSGHRLDGDDCFLQQVPDINHFTLFSKINNATWKGCVEARPEPYDVTDDAPVGAKVDTLFVPYFWADESDRYESWVYRYKNNYLAEDTVPATGFSWTGEWGRNYSILKYKGQNGTISENSADIKGPNRACPDPIQPLTKVQGAVISKIEAMKAYSGGGTIGSEGLMWGWRVLSPGAPFTEGRPYSKDNKKIIVMMTDGENLIAQNNIDGPTISDYTAYGYLRYGRFPKETFADAKSYINKRMLEACKNIKAAGIEIFTVTFKLSDPATIKLYTDCASKPPYYYNAKTSSDLKNAFGEIGKSISKLRVSN